MPRRLDALLANTASKSSSAATSRICSIETKMRHLARSSQMLGSRWGLFFSALQALFRANLMTGTLMTRALRNRFESSTRPEILGPTPVRDRFLSTSGADARWYALNNKEFAFDPKNLVDVFLFQGGATDVASPIIVDRPDLFHTFLQDRL